MNLFYAPPGQIRSEDKRIELRDQEARHAIKVLRYREGDAITVVDGEGGWYEGTVRKILNGSVQVKFERRFQKSPPTPNRILGLAIVKRRDRLEFAVEKAVELGAAGIALFRTDHTVKENVRIDRLEATVLSAMKQSLRAHLPAVRIFPSVDETVEAFSRHKPLVAHEKKEGDPGIPQHLRSGENLLLLVGPEGGFSEEEIARLQAKGAEIISLGEHRLRAETAAVALLSQFI